MFDGDALDGQLQQSIAEFLDSRTIVGDREVLVEGVDMMSSLSLDTSIPTQTRVRAATGSMVKSLSCRCALVHGAASRRPLCRLFGLIPCKRRRSCSVTVSEDSGTIDLAPLVAVPGATLRFAPGTATPSIEPCFWFLGNIQGLRENFYHQGTK